MKTTWYSLYLFFHITLLSLLLCTYSLPHVFGIKVRFGWIVLCGICISFFIVHQSFSFWQTVTTKSNGFYFWFYRSGRKHKTILKTLTSWNKDDTFKNLAIDEILWYFGGSYFNMSLLILANPSLFSKCHISVCMGCMRVFIGRLNAGCIMVYPGNKVDSTSVFLHNDKTVTVISSVLSMTTLIHLNLPSVVIRKMYEFNSWL